MANLLELRHVSKTSSRGLINAKSTVALQDISLTLKEEDPTILTVAGESGSTTHVGPSANQFQIGTAGIIGFVFETTVGGPDFYGWAKVVINNAGAGSIIDWAYDNTPGTSIQAGQIAPVPEPATLAVGLLCIGAGIARRRRA